MEPHRGWTIASSSSIFLWKQWLDQEQELITVIQEETKRTEENEEAGYRSPTWSILQALQRINKAKRHEGEAVMSAIPFFQSAGRGSPPRPWRHWPSTPPRRHQCAYAWRSCRTWPEFRQPPCPRAHHRARSGDWSWWWWAGTAWGAARCSA